MDIWLMLGCYLILHSEKEDVTKCLSLKALRNNHQVDVETAIEIQWKKVQDVIPAQRIITMLVPELEFKNWKKNGENYLEMSGWS